MLAQRPGGLAFQARVPRRGTPDDPAGQHDLRPRRGEPGAQCELGTRSAGRNKRTQRDMTKGSEQKAALVFTKDKTGPKGAATVQLAVPIPREVSRWFRHYALDHDLSMAALIRQILRDFMAAHGGPAE